MADPVSTLPVGIEVLAGEDIQRIAAFAHGEGYKFVVPPLLKLGSVPVHDVGRPLPASLNHANLVVNGPEYAQLSIGSISPWIDLESSDQTTVSNSQILVQQQIHWASHIGLPGVIFHCPPSGSVFSFARSVAEAAGMLSHTQVYVRVSLSDGQNDAWTRWNAIRMLARHNAKIAVALEINHELPGDDTLKKWLAEPVKMVIVPTNTFVANRKGFPVLRKRHQVFLQQLMQSERRYVIASADFESIHPSGTLASYREYLEHLHRTVPEPDTINRFADGYHDYLQLPLQPLMDNLESAIYEVFEQDPIKYQQYEQAVYRALIDRVPEGSDAVTVIMVVGAGRGPLVDRSIRAASDANRKVKLYAVEKNANAVVGLRARKQEVWGDAVTVVHVDMRYWNPEEKADILVSELLGSFGDNELSPECLDGAQRLLKPNGISIPSQYVSYVAPLSSSKLFNDAAAFGDEEHMETPYVVKFRSVFSITDPQALWSFDHPTKSAIRPQGHPHFNVHNNRYSKATFSVSQDAVMHGIAGYFEATLYKDVKVSIHPETHSKDMFSWFPIFFPIRVPLFLPRGSEVTVHFWRATDTRKVWYEWCVVPTINGVEVVGEASAIHNPGGKSYWIGL